MSDRDDDDAKDIQILLRNITAMVLLVLFSLIVVAALLSPFIHDPQSEPDLDTTLLLGLAASISGGIPVLLGVTVALRRNGK